jgi:hypothetical protein
MSETIETATFWTGYQQLETELATGTPHPPSPSPASPKLLPVGRIEMMPSVFQPRVVGDELATDRHLASLMDAIMQEVGNVLDPVVVWWSGKRWLIIDGHHRLQAHTKLLSKKKGARTIPVNVFRGTLSQAHDESIRLNAKDKLAMAKEDKATKAWHIVVLNQEASIRKIASLCKVGKSSVGRMTKKRNDLIAMYDDEWLSMVDGMTWTEVLNFGVERDIDEEWEDRQVLEWAKRLNKTFGSKPQNQPELFARALERYSPHLLDGLAEYLRDDFRGIAGGDDFNDDF